MNQQLPSPRAHPFSEFPIPTCTDSGDDISNPIGSASKSLLGGFHGGAMAPECIRNSNHHDHHDHHHHNNNDVLYPGTK
jgi:hypothetical protein